MSQWNRTTLPTEGDSDEWGNILVLRSKGRKSIQHWEDFCDEKSESNQLAWMSLPSADDVEDETKQISIAITAGDRTVTIKKVDDTIEIHDSEDPMGQPVGWHMGVGNEGLLTTVKDILTQVILVDEIMNKPEEESTGCCKNCNCKREREGGRNFDWEFGRYHSW